MLVMKLSDILCCEALGKSGGNGVFFSWNLYGCVWLGDSSNFVMLPIGK